MLKDKKIHVTNDKNRTKRFDLLISKTAELADLSVKLKLGEISPKTFIDSLEDIKEDVYNLIVID